MTSKFSGNYVCKKRGGDIGEAVDREERLCDEEETIRDFAYLSYLVSTCRRCEVAVAARARCG